MANVIHPQIEFHPRPVNHSPSPFGFGFGLSSPSSAMSTWSSAVITPGHTQPAAFHQLASSIAHPSPLRVQKRRLESDDTADTSRNHHSVNNARDDAMDRSPTPERPKRAPPKRARVTPPEAPLKDEKKENRAPGTGDVDDVDVGVLLASLPPQSLLPLLTSLLNAQPGLKSVVIPLIPRPTLDTAIQALALSAKKLRDAYPYSNATSFSQPGSSATSFGFGSGFGAGRANVSAMGFGRPVSSTTNTNNGGMRDSYIVSRLRPHITEFVAACMSYLPYFTYILSSDSANPTQSGINSGSSAQSHSRTIQTQHKDRSHPSETYLFLSAVTNHLLSQPPLTQSSLGPLLLPRLSEEWKAWVDRVDEVVNRQGGMFGSETVRAWEKGLDEFADHKGPEGVQVMREVRDRWVSKVGWLVGRMGQQPMEEL